MKVLLDENLDQMVAPILSLLGARRGDMFVHILDVADAGTDDLDIPDICEAHGVGAIITVNYKDFGAKKAIYAALINAGVDVIVIRPGKIKFTPEQQVSILSGKYPTYIKLIEDGPEHQLVKVTQSEVKARSLEQLLEEFDQ